MMILDNKTAEFVAGDKVEFDTKFLATGEIAYTTAAVVATQPKWIAAGEVYVTCVGHRHQDGTKTNERTGQTVVKAVKLRRRV